MPLAIVACLPAWPGPWTCGHVGSTHRTGCARPTCSCAPTMGGGAPGACGGSSCGGGMPNGIPAAGGRCREGRACMQGVTVVQQPKLMHAPYHTACAGQMAQCSTRHTQCGHGHGSPCACAAAARGTHLGAKNLVPLRRRLRMRHARRRLMDALHEGVHGCCMLLHVTAPHPNLSVCFAVQWRGVEWSACCMTLTASACAHAAYTMIGLPHAGCIVACSRGESMGAGAHQRGGSSPVQVQAAAAGQSKGRGVHRPAGPRQAWVHARQLAASAGREAPMDAITAQRNDVRDSSSTRIQM